jgi:molybdenum cofactor cytidylyltransferase
MPCTSDAGQKFCGIILAAGESSRMGTQKPLLPWPPSTPGSTLLSALIAALKPFAEAVIVVAGKNAPQLAPIITATGAILVENPDPTRGQFSSLRTGLRAALDRGFTAAIVFPVDSPPLTAASLEKLCNAFRTATASGLWGVVPQKEGHRGHSLLANTSLIEAFLNSPADSNAKAVKQLHDDRIQYVEIDDPFFGLNINTPEDYAGLCRSKV